MDHVFAPWRIEWVEREGGNDDVEGCVFCAFAGGNRDRDRERRVVARSPRSFVLLNNYPYNPGHVMVIPETHAGDYRDLDDDALLDHARLKQRTFDALDDGMGPDAYNAGLNLGGKAAGGSIEEHLQAVADTYDRLHEAFAAQAGAEFRGEDRAVEFEFE
ncbi:HIT family hydrolase [Halobacteriales archaeon QH_6_68_27]|nr:MAG: HIT family hydrolase [Halobacteriales archaeon QH_6_68_27]